jgi:hypothetical protein
MKTLREGAQDYLRMRRGLGFKLQHHERRLRRFVTFMEQQYASHITSELALNGHATCRCAIRYEWRVAHLGARFHTLLQRRGPADRSSSGGPPVLSRQACDALPV